METIFEDWVHEMLILTEFLLEYAFFKKIFLYSHLKF